MGKTYSKRCKFCGAKIVMVELSPRTWVPKNPDYTPHDCDTYPYQTGFTETPVRHYHGPSIWRRINDIGSTISWGIGIISWLFIGAVMLYACVSNAINPTAQNTAAAPTRTRAAVSNALNPSGSPARPTATPRITNMSNSRLLECVEVVAGALNVRAGPGTAYVRLFSLERGDMQAKVGSKNGWYAVLISVGNQDAIGWMSGGDEFTTLSDCEPRGTNAEKQSLVDGFDHAVACMRKGDTCELLLPEYFTPVVATAVPVPSDNCDASYPTLCIPRNASDLDCEDISARRFPVMGSDPHGFDLDYDGIGCEWD